jgi:predicted nuclease of restriction endonuclease-like (RecB) superfamily
MTEDNEILSLKDSAIIIKDAIVRSRYQAAQLVNRELLSLYYSVGKYVSDNSRTGYWGKSAIRQLSDSLQRELPGLHGFSESAIKKMRLFYETWQPIFTNRSLMMNDLQDTEFYSSSKISDMIASGDFEECEYPIDLSLLEKHMVLTFLSEFSMDAFYKVGFTHHYTIMSKEKSIPGRAFYITQCAENFWTVEALKSNLRGELFVRLGAMPNNFLQTLPEQEQARRAIRSFKDEYFLDYINIEDENDPEERVLENAIIANIKRFMMTLGDKFCYIRHQYRMLVEGQEFFTDLLFFHRELRCLIAIDLKRGVFKPSFLGQMNFYLSALDKYVRQENENPSIGIILCKEANRNIVEFAVRDYSKPMGVATYRTRNEMPENLQKALPDFEEMRKLMETPDDFEESEGDE